MKTKTSLLFIILMSVCGLTAGQQVYVDFYEPSPSGHILYYTITDNVSHRVCLNGMTTNDTCGQFIVVPDSVAHNGVSYKVSSVGSYWMENNPQNIWFNPNGMDIHWISHNFTLHDDETSIIAHLPATIDTIRAYAFATNDRVAIFHSPNPPMIDSLAFPVAYNNVYVPCGSVNAYQAVMDSAVWAGDFVYCGINETLPFIFRMPVYGYGGSGIYLHGYTTWNDATSICGDSSTMLSATAGPHYQLDHWWDGNTSATRPVHITSDTVLTAYFVRQRRMTYQFDHLVNGIYDYGAGTVEGPDAASWGDTVTLIAHANYGYEFVRWKYPHVYDTIIHYPVSVGDSMTLIDTVIETRMRYQYSTDSVLTYAIVLWGDEYHSASVTFRKRNFWFEVQSEDWQKGSVNCDLNGYYYADSLPYNTSITIYATASYGYQFSHWSDGVTSNYRTISLTQDTLLTAFFVGLPVTVTVNNITPEFGTYNGAGTYHRGDLVTLTAQPFEHYHFLSWINVSHGNVQTYDTDTFMFIVTTDTSFELRFEIDHHHVEASPNNIAYGVVYGGGDYDYGSAVSVSATPYSGYQFVRWSNGVTYNPYTFAVLDDVELTAIFDEVGATYTITATSADHSMGEVTGGSNYLAGEVAVLTAIPCNGCMFDHWDDGETTNPRTITVLSDSSFVAYFASTQGVSNVIKEDIRIYTRNGRIVVEGVSDDPIWIFDMVGRRIGDCSRVLPAGVYLVKIGNYPTRKVVVIR